MHCNAISQTEFFALEYVIMQHWAWNGESLKWWESFSSKYVSVLIKLEEVSMVQLLFLQFSSYGLEIIKNVWKLHPET